MALSAPAGFRGIFRVDDAARAVYSEAAGIARVLPRAVAVPHGVADVQTLVRWAQDEGRVLVPRGSGSSMAGGAIGPGVVVDLSRLRAIGAPDAATRSIGADVGVLRGEIQRRAASVGLRLPVDPSSGEFCTVGGMAATNAAGAHSLRHGSMRPWVLALQCVFDDGTVATVRRGQPLPDAAALQRFTRTAQPMLIDDSGVPRRAVRKDSSGYALDAFRESHDVIDLLVGSEGTLAIFTAVEVALAPATAATASFMVSFETLDAAVGAAIVVREAGASACELLDRTFLTIAAKGGHALPVPPDSDAVLMIEIEGDSAALVNAEAERLASLLRTRGARVSILALDAARELEMWAFRHAASPALSRLDPSLRSMQFIEDGAVPPQSLAAYVRGVRAILDAHETPGVIFGHAGDAHVHVNPLVNVSRHDWRARVERILDETTDLVARLGGTLSGEHGDGRLRAPLLGRVRSDAELRRYAAIKHAFDPEGIFNRGVKLAAEGARSIDDVKYDPALAALPPTARSALETVERERAYSQFRLDLL
ncbi:MAG TPA: FAD-binding oxidoreductase [Gemmatimonadaceae bacterium]|nr:FAD-binding oxidoreductase [Gemmatimonadaceae bacterium]